MYLFITSEIYQIGQNLAIWLLCTWAFFTFSPKISCFKTWFAVLIFTFKHDLMSQFWYFKLSFNILATILATFPKIGLFFLSFSHTVFKTTRIKYLWNCDQEMRAKRRRIRPIRWERYKTFSSSSLKLRTSKLDRFST